MIYRILADVVMLVHFAFVIFVGVGAFLLLRWRWLAWVHAPCAVYGAAIELFRWICPLSPLEWKLREMGGGTGVSGSFIEHYLEGVLYPKNLDDIHLILGAIIVAVNGAVYAWVFLRRRWQRPGENL